MEQLIIAVLPLTCLNYKYAWKVRLTLVWLSLLSLIYMIAMIETHNAQFDKPSNFDSEGQSTEESSSTEPKDLSSHLSNIDEYKKVFLEENERLEVYASYKKP